MKEINEENYAENYGKLALFSVDSSGNIIGQVPLNITIHDVIYHSGEDNA